MSLRQRMGELINALPNTVVDLSQMIWLRIGLSTVFNNNNYISISHIFSLRLIIRRLLQTKAYGGLHLVI